MVSGDLAGVLDRVLSVDVQADRVVLATEPIDFIEAIAEIDLDFEGPEVAVEIREVEDAQGQLSEVVRLQASNTEASLQRVSPGLTCTFSGTDNAAAGIDVQGPSFRASFRASFSLKPRIVLKAGLLSGVTEFSMTMNASLSATAKTGSVTATLVPPQPVTCQKNIKDLRLPGIPAYAFTFRPAAAFPVGVNVDLSKLGAQAKIGGPEGMASATGKAGIKYTSGGGWETVADSSVDGRFVPFTLSSNLPDEVTIGLEAFGKIDVGIAADLGRARLSVELVRFNFFEASAGGDYDLTVRPPISTSDAGYTGPDWDLDLFFCGKLKAELTTGALFTLIKRIGISLSFSLGSLDLFNVERVLDTSPTSDVVARTLDGGADQKILEVDVGDRDAAARMVRVTVRASEDLDGTANFVSSKNGSSPLADFGSASFASPTASFDWSPAKADVGDWLIRARKDVDLSSTVLPYASSDAVLVRVKEADLVAPELLELTAEVEDPASGTLVLGNAGTIDLTWAASVGAPFTPSPSPGSVAPGMDGGPEISANCLSMAQTILGSITLATNDPDSAQRDLVVGVQLECTPNLPPQVALTVDGPSTMGDRPFSVPFAWVVTDLPHAMPVLPCTFDPGDGTGSVEIADCFQTTGRTHLYENNGMFTASLSVRDSKGMETVKTLGIIVNAPPEIDLFTADPVKGSKPLDVSFDWLVSDDDAGDALSCVLDFGDGSSEMIADCSLTTSTQHEYDALGGYTARLTVEDPKMSSDSEDLAITVETDASVVVLGQDATDPMNLGAPKFYRVFLSDGQALPLADRPAGERSEAFASLSAVLVEEVLRVAYWKDARWVDDGMGGDLNDLMHRFRLIDVGAGTDTVFVQTDMIFNSGQRLSFTPSGTGVLFVELGAGEKVERAEVAGLNAISNLFDLGPIDDTVSPPCGLQPIYVDVSGGEGARQWRVLAGCGNWVGSMGSVQFAGIVLYDPAGSGRTLFPAPVGVLDFANPIRTPAGAYWASGIFEDFSFATQRFTTPGVAPTTLLDADLNCTSDLVDGFIACLEAPFGGSTSELLLLDEMGATSVLPTLPPLLMKPGIDFVEPAVVGAP